MKLSKATNYALHSLVHLAAHASEEAIKVEELAERQKLSPTYLSKILTKLVKADLVESTPGVKGGYRLLRAPEDCSFLDVIYAIEGYESILKCTMKHETTKNSDCLIELAMKDVERQMKDELQSKTIAGIVKQARERQS